MARWFTMFSMNDHFTAVEQELERKLFRADGHFAEFDEAELTRGDTKTRHESYRIARGSMQEPGYMTPNEIRAAEGLPPVAGGDTLTGPWQAPPKENDR
jgi:phage portal protein BeeE